MGRDGAASPEELETLFEDACFVRDRDRLAALFEDGALLVAGDGAAEARGEDIARAAEAMWGGDGGYVADPWRVLQASDTALVLGPSGISVARRGADRRWRYAISLLDHDTTAQEDEMTETTTTPGPLAVASGEGEARWWLGALAVIKATAADTGGRMTIVEMTEPPGAEAPLHVHHREDEAFWILDGEVTLRVGDATIAATAGDLAFGPRDVPHGYTVGDAGCRMLFICTPGGFEYLMREMSEPATTRAVPPPADAAPDLDWVAGVARKHGCDLLL
jgi:quercetin dioxygenase-like cupin family protein